MDDMLALPPVITYSDCWLEMYRLKQELANIDDEYLLDECQNIQMDTEGTFGLDNIYSRFFYKGNLTLEQRKKLEGLYILYYGAITVKE